MPIVDAAGIVLTGGRSSRMGEPKAGLDWHGSTLLYRAAALLKRTVAGPVVIVGAPGQVLPAPPAGVEVVSDPVEGTGPLLGIATGLAAVAGRAEAAFVCATDMPFLHPAFAARVLRALTADLDVVLPVALGHHQPLAAAYRTALAPRIHALIAAGRTRPGMLYAEVRVLRLDDAALLDDPVLAAADPALDSLLGVNDPAAYRAALARPLPLVRVRGHGMRSAATLGGLGVNGHAVELNGEPTGYDPELPLVTGDEVAPRPA